jgi:CRISPR-associated protein Csm3
MATDKIRKVILHGRVFIRGDIVALTGLHIGGAAGALEIGGVDSPVIRNPLDYRPYIPGSSLRGKMRSLTERLEGSEQNFAVNRARGKEVFVHTCQAGKAPADDDAYRRRRAEYQREFQGCRVCSVFGVTGDEPVPHPTSLIVRDAHLSRRSIDRFEKAQTDFPYTEIKWEATIDRVTSAATPRQIERVPAGAIFEGFELVYGIYDAAGLSHFPVALKALQLVEEDYLGGLGSRGGGKVIFLIKEIYARRGQGYERVNCELNPQPEPPAPEINPQSEPPGIRLTDELVEQITAWVNGTFASVHN